MALLRFKAGAEVTIEGVPYRFVEFLEFERPETPAGWTMRRLNGNNFEFIPLTRLKLLYDSNQLRALHTTTSSSAGAAEVARRHRIHVPDDLPSGDRKRREVRAEFLDRVDARLGSCGAHARLGPPRNGKPDTLFNRALVEVSGEMRGALEGIGLRDRNRRKKDGEAPAPPAPDGKPGDATPDKAVHLVDASTYYRWRRLYNGEDRRGLEGNHAARGNRNQLLLRVREAAVNVMKATIEEAKDKRGVGKTATVTMTDIEGKINAALVPDRLREPDLAEKLKAPSRPTLHRIWNQFPAFDRAVAMKGWGRARREFRFVRGHEGPQSPYELIEYDETTMPFMFVDEVHGVRLGKANLCAALCVATHCCGGFHLGFEPFGDMTMMSTLRHAVSLKSYVPLEYPQIRNEYVPGGMFRCVGIDNSRQAWGATLKEVASTLDCDRTWLPPRTPWFKPIVEGFFRILNVLLLQYMPGFVLGRNIDAKDYDPAMNACIGLRFFTFLFHAWLCDIYHQRPQEGLGNRSPNQKWRELLANGEPALLDSADDVESLFGVVREGVLDHRGIRFMNIRYGGPELEALLRECGTRQKVRFKIDPLNLLRARVWHPRMRGWVRGEAYRRDYANGLSVHVHTLVQANIKRQGLEENEDSHILGLQWLKELIADSLPRVEEIGSGPAIARALGLNSDRFIRPADGRGQLCAPSGPYEGQALNLMSPLSPMFSTSTTAERPLVAEPAPLSAAGPVRPRRQFHADDSIAHVSPSTERRRP